MASPEIETVNAGADKAKVAGSLVLLLSSFVVFYLLSKQGALVQWLGLLVLIAAAVGVFLTSESGRRFDWFWSGFLPRTGQSCLARAQGSHSDDHVCVWFCVGHVHPAVVH